MTITLKLKYVDELSGGRKRFRRRFPKNVQSVFETEFFQEAMKACEGAALVREHEHLMRLFDKLVSKAEASVSGTTVKTPRDKWLDALREADRIEAETVGLDDVYEEEVGGEIDVGRRVLIAETMLNAGSDPILIKAMLAHSEPTPKVTLQDAVNIYLEERLSGPENEAGRIRLSRVFKRVKAALGDLSSIALTDLKRKDGRAIRDYMLTSSRNGGGTLKPATVQRELNLVRALISMGIREFGLSGQATNPIEGLSVAPSSKAALTNEADTRDPLPPEVLQAMSERMKRGSNRNAELGLIWRLLAGTGCRMAEITGLRVEDVIVGDELPHIRVRWNEDRRLKTQASIRSVPLVGDALEAAKEALTLPREVPAVFPRYARERGADTASQSLMKNLRTITQNPRHVNHSLRHNMKDWLREAGVSVLEQNLILGLHSVAKAIWLMEERGRSWK
jgi:integrase